MTAAPLLELVRDPLPTPVGRANVRRPRLVAELAGPGAPALSVLIAPAGFGKTRVLREWATRDPRPFAWVTLNPGHDEPAALLRAVSRAVDTACASSRDGRVVVVLDNLHVLRHPAARDTIAAILDGLPPEFTVALASRAEPPVPLARWRAEGRVTELRHGDLAMTRSEAAALVRSAGLKLGRDELDALVRATEGWPAALSLATLSLADQPVAGAAVSRFGGGDRLIAEYLRDEVLADLAPDERRFVEHTAVLDVLTAPLCDALLERSGSADTLTALQRSGFPLVALDRTTEHVRLHRLLADLLRADLSRRDRGLAARLHRRASAAYATAGDPDRALQHALAADEVERAGDLVWSGLPRSDRTGLQHHGRALVDALQRRRRRGAPAAGPRRRRHAARPRSRRPRRALAHRGGRGGHGPGDRRRRRGAAGGARARRARPDDPRRRAGLRPARARESLSVPVRAAAGRRRPPPRGRRRGAPATGGGRAARGRARPPRPRPVSHATRADRTRR